MAAVQPILIVGGGIGGLSLALALGRADIPAVVLEQADNFSDIGAGLQLSPNAVRRLDTLGVRPALEGLASQPDCIQLYDGVDGAALNEVPLGATALARYGAPYWVMARKDLQATLLEAVRSCASVEVRTGQKFVDYQQNETGVTASMVSGARVEGALLVGADGIWSRVRHMIAAEAVPQRTGFVAWRALLGKEDAPALFSSSNTRAWLAPDAHMVAYRVGGGDWVNLVAVTKGEAQQRSWDEALPRDALFERLRPWHKSVRGAVMEVPEWRAWPLMVLKPFKPWHKRRLMVMGDAAHAVVPFLAQGAALAIEDAVLLGELIGEHLDDLPQVPALFQEKRYRRCLRVFSKSIYNGQIYHAHGVSRRVRNFGLKRMPSRWLLRQYDWVYEG